MSVTITTAQVQQYRNNVQIKFQQMGSLLRPFVRLEQTQAKYHYFDLLAPTAAVKNTARHAGTPLVNSQHERRRVEMFDFDWADLIDSQDRVRMLISPEGSYVENAVAALGRSLDQEIITAFQATAAEGETGASAVTFDTANWEIGGAAAPMSVDLLRQAKYKLDVGNVPSMGRHIVLGPKQLQDLLEETEVTSADFNSVRALVQGDLDTFLGFKFHRVDPDLLPYDSGTDRRSCYAWHERAMGIAMGKEIATSIDKRADRRNAMQVYVCAVFGAVRIEDVVVHIDCDESP